MYVIGDSISARAARQIVRTGRAAGFKTYLRARDGFDTGYQMYYRGWPNGVPSFTDAVRSGARAVLVQLGTNDVGCLRYSATMCRTTPPVDSPRFPRWYRNQVSAIVRRMKAAVDQLLDAGKCVIWAGPRESESNYARKSDSQRINRWLKRYSANHPQHPGKFIYADWDRAVYRTPALNADLVAQTDSPPNWPDSIHPQTEEGRQALANFQVRYAKNRCGLKAR
jgi:hypothetical protein